MDETLFLDSSWMDDIEKFRSNNSKIIGSDSNSNSRTLDRPSLHHSTPTLLPVSPHLMVIYFFQKIFTFKIYLKNKKKKPTQTLSDINNFLAEKSRKNKSTLLKSSTNNSKSLVFTFDNSLGENEPPSSSFPNSSAQKKTSTNEEKNKKRKRTNKKN